MVPIGAPLAEVLTQAMRGKLPAARVVLNSNGRTPSRQAVLRALKEVQKRHSLPPRYLHASGADLRDAVARLPGNAKPLGN